MPDHNWIKKGPDDPTTVIGGGDGYTVDVGYASGFTSTSAWTMI